MKGIAKTVSDLHINEEMLKDASKRLKIKPKISEVNLVTTDSPGLHFHGCLQIVSIL
jgi:hypothetical protein